jgi:ADP-heptose:LPS heptosyltransferase
LTAFWERGFYERWLEEFSESAVIETLRLLADAGKTVVIMGAAWDKGGIAERVAAADPRFQNLVGETDFDALGGLLRGASAVFGFPGGNTLLGPYFGTPTVLLWNTFFPEPFWRNTCPPVSTYRAIHTAGATSNGVSSAVLELAA